MSPRTPLEQRLAARWSELLGIEWVGLTDDFFDLGGDSMAAALLFSWIADTGLGPAELPASTLLWAPTVAQLAAVLEEGGARSPRGSIVVIDREGSEPPLFFVHSHDGGIVSFVPLARRLRSEHPFYGIEMRSKGAGDTESPSVEALGRAYAEEIRSLQASGPYYLGGRCFGAAVALEIARILTAAGERVGLLAAVDPLGEPPVRFARHYWRRFRYYQGRGELFHALRRLRRRRRWLAETRREIARDETPLQRSMRRAGRSYVARPYDGSIALLTGEYYTTPRWFWQGVALGGLHAYPPIDGDLARAPAIDVLASQLSDALREAG